MGGPTTWTPPPPTYGHVIFIIKALKLILYFMKVVGNGMVKNRPEMTCVQRKQNCKIGFSQPYTNSLDFFGSIDL